MYIDDQGRQTCGHVIAQSGRIIQPVHFIAVVALPGDGLRRRELIGLQGLAPATAVDADFAIGIEGDYPRRNKRRGRDGGDSVALARNCDLRQLGILLQAGDLFRLSARQIVAPDGEESTVVLQIVQGCAVTGPTVRAQPLRPGRRAVFRQCARDLSMAMRFEIVEVDLAPAAGVTDIRQVSAVGRKLGLEDCGFIVASYGDDILRTGRAG